MKPTPTAIHLDLLALALMAAGRTLPGHQARATEIQPLDLAVMVLTPADVEIHGLSGYGNDYGEYLTTRDYAAGFTREKDIGFESALEILENIGLLRSYTVRLALPSEPADFYSDATEGTHVAILEYDGDASAGVMLELARAEIENADVEVVESPKEFGDQSLLSRSNADDPKSGDPAREITLEFRVGHLNALITMFDIAREGESSRPTEPEIAIMDQLVELLLERIESAELRSLPAIGTQVLSVTAENRSVVTVSDRDSVIDGKPHRRYAETDHDIATLADMMDRDRLFISYVVEQDVASSIEAAPGDPHLIVRLYELESDAAAAEWLVETAYD